MNRLSYWTVTALAASCLLLVAAHALLQTMNRSLRADVETRQQYVQQSLQLEGLYREIVRSLAELGARNKDEQVRALLERHGITYSVNTGAATGSTSGSASGPTFGATAPSPTAQPTPPARK